VKKALLIAAGLMAINLPVNAAQVNQFNAGEVNVSQRSEQIQTETNLCVRTWSGWRCY
jgi:hypothetical protein